MFKGIERWILYICFAVPVVIFTVLILIQRQYSWHFNQVIHSAGDQSEQILMMNELFIKTFFLIFFCFLLILFGSMVVFRELDRNYKESPVHRLSDSVLATTPGLAMVGIGCFLLIFSVFRSPSLPFLPNLYSIEMGHKSLTAPAATQTVAAPADSLPATVSAHSGVMVQPAGEERPLKAAHEQQSPVSEALTPPGASSPPVVMEPKGVTTDDRAWAGQLETNAIRFGYYPTKSDNDRYNAIYSSASAGESAAANTDNHWAFGLLQKMQKGYEPSQAEMSRYEKIVAGDLTSR